MGPYVFLSHSVNDIAKARKVRNYLEERSAEPILFNLKCLTDSDELSVLVRREIEAREWFLYLGSAHAEASARVQAEVSYARDILKKKIFRIDLENVWLLQKIALNRMIGKMRR